MHVRRIHWRRLAHMPPVEATQRADTDQAKTFGDLVLKQLQHADDAFEAGRDQPIAIEATNANHVGA